MKKKPGSRPAQRSRVKFAAKNIFAGDQNANRSVSCVVAPDADEQARKGPAGTQFSLLQNICSYEGFRLGGHVVVSSIVTGLRTQFSDGTWTAEGYEWGTCANGDHYLSRVKEKGDAKGTQGEWRLVQGTGSLTGITGEATYKNSPVPGAVRVVSTLNGWYSLPKQK
jgi:hypothetical protein